MCTHREYCLHVVELDTLTKEFVVCQLRQWLVGTRAFGMGGAAFWYFLGRGRPIPFYGERATGGSFRPATGARYVAAPSGSAMTRSAAISRGGFGASASRFGGAGA